MTALGKLVLVYVCLCVGREVRFGYMDVISSRSAQSARSPERSEGAVVISSVHSVMLSAAKHPAQRREISCIQNGLPAHARGPSGQLAKRSHSLKKETAGHVSSLAVAPWAMPHNRLTLGALILLTACDPKRSKLYASEFLDAMSSSKTFGEADSRKAGKVLAGRCHWGNCQLTV